MLMEIENCDELHMWSNIKNSHTQRAIIEQPVHIWPQSCVHFILNLMVLNIIWCNLSVYPLECNVLVTLSECFVLTSCLNDEKETNTPSIEHTKKKTFSVAIGWSFPEFWCFSFFNNGAHFHGYLDLVRRTDFSCSWSIRWVATDQMSLVIGSAA